MDSEPIPQAKTDSRISDTVTLPGLEGEYIHIDTNKNALSSFFGQLAQVEGRDPEAARRFFDERVSIGVGGIKDVPRYKQSELGYKDDPILLRKLDAVTDSIYGSIYKILGSSGDFLAAVSPEPNGKFRLTFNTQAITQVVSRGAVPHFGNPNNYASLPPEAKIAYLRDSMQSILTHESTHLFQVMDNPDLFEYTAREKVQARALPLFVLSSSALAALPLQSREQIIIVPSIILGTGLATIGGMFYLNKTGKMENMQHEAYHSQEVHANSGLNNPFTFTVENDPKPSVF